MQGATPWLSSPHFQTAFMSLFGRPLVVHYRRQLFYVHDGGTIAMDWLLVSDASSSTPSTPTRRSSFGSSSATHPMRWI